MKNRRAISTVVGAVFFVIAMTIAISYISYSMDTLDKFVQTVMVKSSLNQDRVNEDLQITKATIDGNKFNLTIMNEGTVPIHLIRLWVTNQTDNTVFKRDLDLHIKPSEQKIKIGQSVDLYANTNSEYKLKVVTSRGTSSGLFLSSDVDTNIQLIGPAQIAPDVQFTTTTIISNNSTQPNAINDLTPYMQIDAGAVASSLNIDPTDIENLGRGETAVFTQIHTAPSAETTITFNASYVGAPTGSFDRANVVVKNVEVGSAATAEWSENVKRVGILISGIPNPVSGKGDTGIVKFGLGVINPLDRDVLVYGVGIQSSQKLFEKNPESGSTPSSGWNFLVGTGASSLLYWDDTTPVTVSAGGIEEFKFRQDVHGSSVWENGIIIEALTSVGKFTSRQTMSVHDSWPSVQVYYASDGSSESAARNSWGYVMKNIPDAGPRVFNVTVESNSDQNMDSLVQLVIITPTDFGVPTHYGSNSGWNIGGASIVQNVDLSHIIKVETSAFLGQNTRVYQFEATMPAVSQPELYVLQTTAVYTDVWGNPIVGNRMIAAASEAAVQIVP